jgi:hypothetical protein
MSDDIQTIYVYQGLPGTQAYDDYADIPCTLDVKTKGPWADVRAPYSGAAGATGDGTDDTAAIQACFTASPGKKIKFPIPAAIPSGDGYYYVTTTLTPPTTGKGLVLEFSGANKFSSSALIQIDDTFPTGYPVFQLSNATTIWGLNIYHRGTAKYSGTGIRFGDSTAGSPQNIYINDSNFYKLDTAIVYGGRSYYNAINNVTAYMCQNGIVLDRTTSTHTIGTLKAKRFRAWRCSAVSVTAAITSGSAVVTPTSMQHIYVGNVIYGTGIPSGATILSVGASTFTISRNATATNSAASLTTYTSGCSGKGLWIKASLAGVTPTGNQIEFDNPTFEQNPYHIYAEAGTVSLNKAYLGDGAIVPVYVNGGTVIIDGQETETIHGGGSSDFLSFNPCVPTHGVEIASGEVRLKNLTLERNAHGSDGTVTLTSFDIAAAITSGSTTVTPVTTSNIANAQTITGTGIPAGTTVSSVDHDAGTFVISQAATETNAAATLIITKSSSTTRFYGSDIYCTGGKVYSKNVKYTTQYMPRFASSDYNYCEEIPNYIVNGTFSRLDGAAVGAQSGHLNDITVQSNVTLTNRGDNGIGGNIIRVTAVGAAAAYFDIPYYAPHLVGKIARIIAFVGDTFQNGATYAPAVYCTNSEYTLASTTTYGSYGVATVSGQELRSGFGKMGYYIRFDYPVLINKPMGYIRFRSCSSATATSYVDLAGLIMTDQEHAGKLAKYRNSDRIYAAAAPTAGTYVAGETAENITRAEAGGVGSKYVVNGWDCLVGGTPGTWVDRRTLTGN